MFALFFNLYYSMFIGQWNNYTLGDITANIRPGLNVLGEFITSIFGEFQVTNLGTSLTVNYWLYIVAFVLALITSIGIVVLAAKGVKKAFGIFFGQIR